MVVMNKQEVKRKLEGLLVEFEVTKDIKVQKLFEKIVDYYTKEKYNFKETIDKYCEICGEESIKNRQIVVTPPINRDLKRKYGIREIKEFIGKIKYN